MRAPAPALAAAIAALLQPASALATAGETRSISGPNGLVARGEALYARGLLGSGAPLEGLREGGLVVTGAAAACVNCHQRSGLGTVEGRVWVPPITGEYLFQPRTQEPGERALPYVEGRRDRDPYTEETLARAIRDGIDSQGRPLGYAMPRYALDGDDLTAITTYLKKLTSRHVPGVEEGVLHLATIVTPDADPVKRRGVLDVLEHYVATKNQFPLKPTPPMLTSGRTQYAKSMYMANRHWELHVWELTGPASTWRAQLDAQLASQPVYAVLSGVGGSTWAPVHEFCEQHALPCLFPNTEVPVVAERDFYPLYFSKGVLLEAELIARDLLTADAPAPRAVEQVYRAGDSGARAASELSAELRGRGVAVHDTVVPAGAPQGDVTAAVREAARPRTDGAPAVVLWLRGRDLEALGDPPAELHTVYLSGIMAGLERSPLSASWREHARMAYPFDPPGKRGVRLDYPLGWFSFRHIPVVAEQVQTDTYLACSLLAGVLNRMADNFAQPYLIEQLQEQLEHRLITGYYPRLSLATGQRFASKGGYLVHFKEGSGTALVTESDWIVP